MQADSAAVICVDLDGTLLATDTLLESLARLLVAKPWMALMVPFWLLRGRAAFKMQVALHVSLDFESLPVREGVLSWLLEQKAAGARLWLCTGAPAPWAHAAAAHFGIFNGVLCSDGMHNLTGVRKARRLLADFGDKGFAYCGNESRDLHIWRHARQALVAGDARLAQRAGAVCESVVHIPVSRPHLREWARALRLHQWAKNLLVFVPLLAAHRATDLMAWRNAMPAFFAFCLAASAVYLLNDLADLSADRAHPRKRFRPLASGRIPVASALFVLPALLAGCLVLALQVPQRFGLALFGYLLVTLAYSWGLKRVALVDTLVLAGLYTARLLAGAVAVQVPLSFWLLACSGFLFFSLALVKRSAELRLWQANGDTPPAGRGYVAGDLPFVDSLGIAAGLLSVLVLALYLNSADVRILYARPYLLWGLCPLLVAWVCRVWLLASRGRMHDDPVVFALRDRSSLGVAVLGALLVVAAT